MNKVFDTLYKRAKTGAIQYWLLKIDGQHIIKESGRFGTDNPLVHNEFIKTGKNIGKKNQTTPTEQAMLDAESDWKRKHDEGYKSWNDITDGRIRNETHLLAYLEELLPQFNTDAKGELKPMKAPTEPWKKGNKKNKYPKRMEAKLDGVRTTCVIDNQLDSCTVRFLSSSGKPYPTLDHIALQIARVADKFPEGITRLDGEAYIHGLTLEEINELVKKEQPGSGALEFWLFDLPDAEEDQSIRSHGVVEVHKRINSPLVRMPIHTIVNDDAEVLAYYDNLVMLEFEGGMLKDLDGTYQPGQRSSFWTKVKMFDDTEFDIIGMELGQRGTEDLIINCRVLDGKFDPEHSNGTFSVKMGGSRATKQKTWDDKDNIIGIKQLTVKHFDYSKYGIPNLPTGKAIREKD